MGEGSEPPFQRIAIVGLGLIGGSIALAIRERWPGVSIAAVDRELVLDEARRRRIVDITGTDLSAIAGADVVMLAAPVRVNQRLLLALPQYIANTTIVTDAGSTKREIVNLASRLPEHLTFVGGHPLGGAATGGLEHARADLFEGRPWLLTPDAVAPAHAVEQVTMLASITGAKPQTMTAADHDRLMAFVSHLPQVTASALMHVIGQHVPAAQLALSGRGLVDTTRLASSPAAIWRDIVGTNADEIGGALDALIALLQSLRADLSSGDELVDVFTQAAAWRNALS